MGELRAQLRAQPYDCVLDLQGLLKSALWGSSGRRSPDGLRRAPARANRWRRCSTRARRPCRGTLHAVERCRRLAAAHLGYPHARATRRCSASCPAKGSVEAAQRPSAALIPCASRPGKDLARGALDRGGQAPQGDGPVTRGDLGHRRGAGACRAHRRRLRGRGAAVSQRARHGGAAGANQTRDRAGHRFLASGRRARPADDRHLLRPRAGAGRHRRPRWRGQRRRQGPGALAGRGVGVGGAAARAAA